MNRMNKTLALMSITFMVIASGCATESKSVALGGGIGAGTGAAIGGIVDPGNNNQYRTRNIIIGGALGGMAGMMTGALVHEHNESEKQDAFQKGKLAGQAYAPTPGTPPNITNPKVESRWIEGKATGNRYIEGHWEYIISEPAKWESN